MARVVLIHWNAAEAAERLARLGRAGYQAERLPEPSAAGIRALAARPPDAVVIDLDRRPSEAAGVAALVRQRKATRAVPIVVAGGAPERVARVRQVVPDATYASWRTIGAALRKALARPPSAPVVPGTLDGYSGTPLAKKLRIRAGDRVTLLDAPDDFEATLGALPPDVRLVRQARGRSQVVVLFAPTRARLERRFPTAVRAMTEGGCLWIAWPKKASGRATDLGEGGVRRHGLDAGLVDYKICAVDSTWSGLCFARRKA